MRHDRTELEEEIIACKPYKRYKRILQGIKDQFDPEALREEMRGLFQARLTRDIRPKKVDPKVLLDANAVDVSYRSKLVDMRVNLAEYRKTITDASSAVRKWILSEYTDIAGVKTSEQRKNYVDRFFRGSNRLTADIDNLMEQLEWYIKDIDSAGFRMKDMKDLVEMIYTRERSI